jgi:thiol-disulfide isomerase/thioredoxin
MKKIIVAFVLMLFSASLFAQVTIGQEAPEISLPNVAGNTVALSSLKGKIVLLDFWASWCGPCRAANPGIVKLYKKYKDQGFEVYAVSLDESKKKWINAIKRDKLTYTQVIDMNVWDSNVAINYGIEAIPTNFLIDKTGKIVAIDLDGAALEEALKALL